MPIPSEATAFKVGMDPRDQVDYQIDCAGKLLEEGETIASFTIALLSEAVAAGIQIMTGGGRDAATVNANQSVKFWLEVLTGNQLDAGFTAGVTAGIELTVTTNSVPSRRRQRTFTVQVKQL